MTMSNHISFQIPRSPSSQRDRPEQHYGTTLQPVQQQYHQTLDLPYFDATTSFSSQDWTWPYNVPGIETQDVDTSIQRSRVVSEPALDLRQTPPPDVVDRQDVQSLLKPADEAPFLPRSTNISYVHYNNAYARSTGVMTEPLLEEETYSILGSDLGSRFDSGLYSSALCLPSTFRQDFSRDDRSEISAISGAHSNGAVARPRAGRIISDSQVVLRNDKRRRSSQPLPVCSVCKKFWPKNRSDQTFVFLPLSAVSHCR
jgi:hypothetical protein